VEITSRYSGRIETLHHQPGGMVEVGAALVDIRVASRGGAKPSAAEAPANSPATRTASCPGNDAAPGASAGVPGGGESTALGGGSGGRVVAVPLAQPGEGIAECELLTWHVAPGDLVEAFQPLCEVQSDKATVEITSRYSGRIETLHHQPGGMVEVGAALVDIELAEGPAGCDSTVPAQPKAPPSSPPSAAADPPASGGASFPRSLPKSSRAVLASPAVRWLAREIGLELSTVTGSGPGGRITKADALAALEGATASRSSHPPATPPYKLQGTQPGAAARSQTQAPTPPKADKGSSEPPPLSRVDTLSEAGQQVERVPLRGYARAMVKTMTEANKVPHFYFCDEVCMDRLVATRARLRSDPHNARLTYLPFLVKATSLALQDFPALNSQLSQDASEMLRFSAHNIGVAVATRTGLVVPNVKNVQMKSVQQISEDLLELQELAAIGKLTKEHLTNGTLTVSNIGSIGGTYAMPLVNVPEVAIVALGRARSVLQLGEGGAVESRTMMNISWGADHRVVDGATLAGFSNRWKSFIEDPDKMLLKLR